jgi:hypothetical protein
MPKPFYRDPPYEKMERAAIMLENIIEDHALLRALLIFIIYEFAREGRSPDALADEARWHAASRYRRGRRE